MIVICRPVSYTHLDVYKRQVYYYQVPSTHVLLFLVFPHDFSVSNFLGLSHLLTTLVFFTIFSYVLPNFFEELLFPVIVLYLTTLFALFLFISPLTFLLSFLLFCFSLRVFSVQFVEILYFVFFNSSQLFVEIIFFSLQVFLMCFCPCGNWPAKTCVRNS